MSAIDWRIYAAIILFAAAVLMQGCGTLTDANYVLVSKGDASTSFLGKITGVGSVDGKVFKVTSKGDTSNIRVTCVNDDCVTEVNGGASHE